MFVYLYSIVEKKREEQFADDPTKGHFTQT